MVSQARTPQRITLRRRSPHSFDANDVEGLTLWLQSHCFLALKTRTSLEWARLQRGRQLVVIFNSGNVVCQGREPEPAMMLLERLVVG